MSITSSPTPLFHLSELSNGFNHFTKDLYQQCIHSTSGNVIFSPLSLLNALTLLSQATNGNTFEELRKGLYLNENKTITANQFYEFNRQLQKSVGKSTLSIANRVFVNALYRLNQSFQEVAVQKFSSGVESMDFVNNIEAARTINQFIEEKTHSKIKDLVKPDLLNEDTGVVLANAIYFKGNWQYKFDKTLTEKGDFYINEAETAYVDFMQIESNFGRVYSEELEANALAMNYANSKLAFVIVLPKNRTGLTALEAKLKHFDLTKITYSFGRPRGVNVIIPKFKIEYEIELNDAMKSLGMGEIFIPGKANLSGLLESSKPLYVSDVIHKAFIEVNEEGSEAAAASVGIMRVMSKPAQRIVPQFRVDHPFVYYIWDKESQTAVFTGRIVKLENSELSLFESIKLKIKKLIAG